jgi:hypothetical protein
MTNRLRSRSSRRLKGVYRVGAEGLDGESLQSDFTLPLQVGCRLIRIDQSPFMLGDDAMSFEMDAL